MKIINKIKEFFDLRRVLVKSKVKKMDKEKAYVWRMPADVNPELITSLRVLLGQIRPRGSDLMIDDGVELVEAEAVVTRLERSPHQTKKALLKEISQALGDDWKDTVWIMVSSYGIEVKKAKVFK